MFSFSPIADPTRDVLDKSIRDFSKLVGWATIAVAIGVALEAIELLHDVVAWLRKRRREKEEVAILKDMADIFPSGDVWDEAEPKPEHPSWVKRVLRVGLILVVMGVVGEWRCGAKLENAHNDLHQYDLAKITEADQKAGEAKDSAETAHAEADAAKIASKEGQKVANAAKTSASEAQDKIALVSKQAADINDEMKLALSMLSDRKVRDPDKMKASLAEYTQSWTQPVVIKSYVNDGEGFWTCLDLLTKLSTLAPSPGGLKVTGLCGGEPMTSGADVVEGIEIHVSSSTAFFEEMHLLDILRDDGGLGTFADIGGLSGLPEFPKDHVEIIIGSDPRFSLERMKWEQERIKKQTTK